MNNYIFMIFDRKNNEMKYFQYKKNNFTIFF